MSPEIVTPSNEIVWPFPSNAPLNMNNPLPIGTNVVRFSIEDKSMSAVNL